MGADLFTPAGRDVKSLWCALADHLRSRLGAQQFAVWFGTASAVSVAPGRLAVALPNEFTRRWVASHFDDELRRWAESTGVSAVELVVDPSLGARALTEPDVVALARPTEPAYPPGLTTRLLAERGFWSLEPRHRPRGFVVEDLRGTLSVEPTGLGAPAVYEAVVFTALLALWGGGARKEPRVRTSLRQLAGLLGLTWSGRTAEQLRVAIERLKTTTYRATLAEADGGRQRLFSLLDEIQTRWHGPPSTPHRRVEAVFSRAVYEQISQPRILRPVDLSALRRIGPQRDLARRLFLFLEAQPGHRLPHGRELVERLVDERLAATLGCSGPLWRTVSLLRRAGAAICSAADRYLRVELVPRRKRLLEPGEPRYLLRVVRERALRRAR